NTLRRFFGLVKSPFLPSWGTLNILSQYCGYDCYEDLLKINSQARISKNQEENPEVVNYLVSLFKHILVKEHNDETFMALVKNTIHFLQQNPHLSDNFQRLIAKTKNGQDFYFEQCINIDGLNSFFGRGLIYYLREKKTPEAQIFGHSLLCLRAWLSNDPSSCKKHYLVVSGFELQKTIHPFVCGRYFASQVYHADMFGIKEDDILNKASKFHFTIKSAPDNFSSFPAFEYIFSCALFLTGHYDDALYYASYGLQNYHPRHSYVDEGFYISLNLVKANCLLKFGKIKEANQIFKDIHPSKFYFMTKKVNTLLYLCLKEGVKNLSALEVNEIEKIIRETGYVRFKNIFVMNKNEQILKILP
ncbi:MAG: hypothetical protein ACXWWD_08700, partial [Chitinophagaceae bacterium]